jgi:hypothetical protein
VAEPAGLATMTDTDGAEFRAVIKGQTGILNALRQTQMEHDQKIGGLERQVGSLQLEMREGFAQ